MSKRSLIKLLGVFIFIILFLVFIFFYFQKQLKLQECYIAKYSIAERIKISEDEIETVLLPGAFLNEEVITDKQEIIDYYVKTNCTIPRGSLFYKSCLEKIDDCKDSVYDLLAENYLAYNVDTNYVKVNPANLLEGMSVDLYVTVNREQIISDLLLSQVKIIGLYDNNNQKIKDYDTRSILKTIVLAIPKEYVNYLNKSLTLGQISLYVTNNSYDDGATVLNSSSSLIKYLQ